MDFISGSIFWVLACSVKCVDFCSDITLGLALGSICLRMFMQACHDAIQCAGITHGCPSERLVRIWEIEGITEVLVYFCLPPTSLFSDSPTKLPGCSVAHISEEFGDLSIFAGPATESEE